MKFNKWLPDETREMLEKQYKEYIKVTPMTKKEQRALRDWVKDGNSVYENSMGAWADGQVPVEFLTIYRDEEYIRAHTEGMSPVDARKIALNYYGWDTEEDDVIVDYADNSMDPDAELPFS
ncbi:MAG: hypothetical protein Q4B26_18250 [Eubacteriales bacterium]|nr:hypothetical protein [Eubacteriales bacterium]